MFIIHYAAYMIILVIWPIKFQQQLKPRANDMVPTRSHAQFLSGYEGILLNWSAYSFELLELAEYDLKRIEKRIDIHLLNMF